MQSTHVQELPDAVSCFPKTKHTGPTPQDIFNYWSWSYNWWVKKQFTQFTVGLLIDSQQHGALSGCFLCQISMPMKGYCECTRCFAQDANN